MGDYTREHYRIIVGLLRGILGVLTVAHNMEVVKFVVPFWVTYTLGVPHYAGSQQRPQFGQPARIQHRSMGESSRREFQAF